MPPRKKVTQKQVLDIWFENRSVKQTALELNVSRQTVWRRMNEGDPDITPLSNEIVSLLQDIIPQIRVCNQSKRSKEARLLTLSKDLLHKIERQIREGYLVLQN